MGIGWLLRRIWLCHRRHTLIASRGRTTTELQAIRGTKRMRVASAWWQLLPALLLAWMLAAAGCQTVTPLAQGRNSPLTVMAAESFLADIAQNVAGARVKVSTLLPIGVDPHSFEPTPRDIARAADTQVLIVNGAGFEAYLERLTQAARGSQTVIVASQGLASRKAGPAESSGQVGEDDHGDSDPHFWLDPVEVLTYVENIRQGLSSADPPGTPTYSANAAAYATQLHELDNWIREQVAQIPPDRRILVTNHLSLGYFADRYGFRILGTILPGASTAAEPSARHLGDLTELIRQTGAKAIFLETGSQTQLAVQVAREANIRVVEGLHTHSVTDPNGAAPTYLDMMRYDVMAIVEALR
jgi:ABC-type Zn uptake system ZnuABC Zn-binding protein ZnuA